MDKTTFSQELANTTDTIPFGTGYSYYMRDKEPRYPLERRDLLDIAMHLLGAVQKIRGRADGVITLIRPDDFRPLEISFGPTGLPHGGFRHIRAEGLIDTHGTFGASWPHLLLSIATKRALEITDGLSSVDSRQAVRADAARAITLMKPDALADARKRVSDFVRAHIDPALAAQLRLFERWLDDPETAHYLGKKISQWQFDARRLCGPDLAATHDWVSAFTQNFYVEFQFEPTFEQTTTEGIREETSAYRSQFDEFIEHCLTMNDLETRRRAKFTSTGEDA